MRSHLYVCLESSGNLQHHILLREYLRNNPNSVKLYGEMKQKLSGKFKNDIDSYVDGKTGLITSFLKKEGMHRNERVLG